MNDGTTIAKLTITGTPKMRKGRRREVINWLKRIAKQFEKEALRDNVAGRFTARFIKA